MKTAATLSLAVGLLCLAGTSHAGQPIASPAIFGSHTQDTAECIVRNVGKKPVSVSIDIYDESGNALAAASNCSAPIEPGWSCFERATIAFGAAYACAATPSGSAKGLRGTLVLLDRVGSDEIPLRSAELR